MNRICSIVPAGDSLTNAVREDERHAGELGIHGVPFFVIAHRYAISGAQPVDALLSALEKAWDGLSPATAVESELR